MKKRMVKKWVVIVLVVLILIGAVIAVSVFSGKKSATGNSVLGRIGELLGVKPKGALEVVKGGVSPYGSLSSSVRIVGKEITVSNIPKTSFGAYGSEVSAYGQEEELVLLRGGCEAGFFVEAASIVNSRAVFKNTEAQVGERYCAIIPGVYSGEFLFRYEFYVTEALLKGEKSAFAVCDPSPLSNEPYYCASSESGCEFFGAEFVGNKGACEIFAAGLSQNRYVCSPNRFYDYSCYNQAGDCVSGIESAYTGPNAINDCSAAAALKNKENWYLCYCIPQGLNYTGKDPTVGAFSTGNAQTFIRAHLDELEVVSDYKCTQEPTDCLKCPFAVTLYQRDKQAFEDIEPEYCAENEKDSVHDQFPRGIVSVHDSRESCIEEADLYDCRG